MPRAAFIMIKAELAVGPVVKPGPLCALASGKVFPCVWIEVFCNIFRLACDRWLVRP